MSARRPMTVVVYVWGRCFGGRSRGRGRSRGGDRRRGGGRTAGRIRGRGAGRMAGRALLLGGGRFPMRAPGGGGGPANRSENRISDRTARPFTRAGVNRRVRAATTAKGPRPGPGSPRALALVTTPCSSTTSSRSTGPVTPLVTAHAGSAGRTSRTSFGGTVPGGGRRVPGRGRARSGLGSGADQAASIGRITSQTNPEMMLRMSLTGGKDMVTRMAYSYVIAANVSICKYFTNDALCQTP